MRPSKNIQTWNVWLPNSGSTWDTASNETTSRSSVCIHQTSLLSDGSRSVNRGASRARSKWFSSVGRSTPSWLCSALPARPQGLLLLGIRWVRQT